MSTRNLRLGVTLAVLFFAVSLLGMTLAVMSPFVGTTTVNAQTPSCLGDSCDFTCLNSGDAWYSEGTGNGVWMIVHALPIYDVPGPTPPAAAHWYDSTPTKWPPMVVVATYKDKASSTTKTYTMTVNDAGSCDDSDADGHIRCHGDVDTEVELDDHLCDYYGGIWQRNAMGSSGVGANCILSADMGFDFQQEFDEDSTTWCFTMATVQAVEPETGSPEYGLRGRQTTTSCPGSNMTWDATANANSLPSAFTCAEYDETRPDLSNVRLDVYLYYYYR